MEIKIEDWIDHTKSLCWKHRDYYCSGSDYEDLVSEAYLTLVKVCESYDKQKAQRGSFKGYLSWKVHCCIIDYKRKQLNLRSKQNKGLQFNSIYSVYSYKNNTWLPFDVDDPTMACPACIAGAKELDEILDATEVSKEDRHLLKMYYLDGLRLEDIATTLGVTRSAVHQRISRILGVIRKKIK
ncbi:MAG: sigma-70 family RNA polymerase sigma factor [bacterium]|nr:sigma-70 family RNA polymerase sigma factor [bacterium]